MCGCGQLFLNRCYQVSRKHAHTRTHTHTHTHTSFKSKYLTQLVTTTNEEDYKGGKFPKMKEILGFFQSSFNPSQAKKEGVIIPRSGVNQAYDEAMRDVSVVQSKLEEYLQRQRKRLGCKVRGGGFKSAHMTTHVCRVHV